MNTVQFSAEHFMKLSAMDILLAVLAILVIHRLFSHLLKPSGLQSPPKIVVPLIGNEQGEDDSEPADSFDLKDPSRPDKIQCYDPSTMQYLGEMPAMTPEEVVEMTERARQVQPMWAQSSFADRRRVLMSMVNYITSHKEEICHVVARDSGKPRLDTMLGEILTTCEKFRAVCEHGEKWLEREYRPSGPIMMHKRAYVEYHPLGVIGVIAPWNYPFHNFMNHIGSGLMAGDALVIKVSEHTSWSISYFLRIVHEALKANGYPPEIVQVVTGFGDAGAALVSSPFVDKIVFTGSPQVGKYVMGGAAPHLKPVVLELGGKDAFIIMDDCEITDGLVQMLARGVFMNAGQNCCGVERVVVYESKYDELVSKVEPLVSALRQNHPLSDDVDVGAMVMPAQLDIIQELVDDAVEKGARLLVGGRRNEALEPGLFFEPTLLVDVTPDMKIAQEEVFGPVMTVMRVPDDSDEACLEMVNGSHYGLGSSVFSSSQSRATELGQRVRAGMTTINDFAVNYMVQTLPFGGVKNSGFDRFAGVEGLRGLCLQKSVVVDMIPFMKPDVPVPIRYPVENPRALPFTSSMLRFFYGTNLWEKAKGIYGLIFS
jgi:acyl-CoA reductase-like NAD-dependent aldehyde dehydrogenase